MNKSPTPTNKKKKEKLKRVVRFRPAFHKVHEDPKQNFGVGAVTCFMVLIGKKGAVDFTFSTAMHLKETWKFWTDRGLGKFSDQFMPHMGRSVDYHTLKPQFKGQKIMKNKCDWLGKPCYCDGSFMAADEFLEVLMRKGSEEVWKMLEERYNTIK